MDDQIKIQPYLEKLRRFRAFVDIIKICAIAEGLDWAEYEFAIEQRVDDPSKQFVDEVLHISVHGEYYRINANMNSYAANEKQLLAVLAFPDQIRGLMSKGVVENEQDTLEENAEPGFPGGIRFGTGRGSDSDN